MTFTLSGIDRAKNIGDNLGMNIIKGVRHEIVRYNASHYFLEIIKQQNALYMEHNFNDLVLGHTYKDELGTSLMVNKKLQGPRKNFTIAHEIGHLLLHMNAPLPVETASTIETNLNTDRGHRSYEREANSFAAHLLLPDKVLECQLLSSFSITAIKNSSGISKDSIHWRIVNFLMEKIGLTNLEAIYLAEEYTNTVNNSEVIKTELFKTVDDFATRKITYLQSSSSPKIASN